MKYNGRRHIYYGDGKGKTTAAIGQCLRCAASGLSILYFQFLKTHDHAERTILDSIPQITILDGEKLEKRISYMSMDEKVKLRHYNNKALDEIIKFCPNFDMLVLDDALSAIEVRLLSEEKIINFLKLKPVNLEVILTGTSASERVISLGDYVTHFSKVRHPSDEGRIMRQGMDF